jgi:DNA-binding NarL/FixJ family response regulator
MPISVQSGTMPSEPSTAVSSEAGSLLLIEDNPIDALRTMALLRTRVPDMACRHVSTLADATPELLAAADCVLLDLSLPDAKDQEGLKEVLQRATDVPVVVITGQDDPLQTGLESLRNGAQDYLTKGSLDASALERSIRYAIERKGFQAHLAAAAVLSAAAAVMAQGEATSTQATATTAGAEVQAAAARAAAAATDALRATDLTVADAAVVAADAAALAAVIGAADVATTSRAAAAAAVEAATAAAAALAADATASAGVARDAAKDLAERIRNEATEVTALADDVVSAVVNDLVAEAAAVVSPVTADDDVVGRGASSAASARQGRPQAAHSVGFRVLVLTAKLAVATAVLLTLLLLLSHNSAS